MRDDHRATAAPTSPRPAAAVAPTATIPPPTPTVTTVAPTATPSPAATATAIPPTPTAAPADAISPAPVSPWPPRDPWMAVPGHQPYVVTEPAGDPFAGAIGQCTWWAQHERPDENLRGMGNARYWAGNAPLRGLHVGATPAAGATVVLQPGVQGAGADGHVAHVMALYPDGRLLVSEMNSYGNGGGWGHVSFRYVHTSAGVSFFYCQQESACRLARGLMCHTAPCYAPGEQGPRPCRGIILSRLWAARPRTWRPHPNGSSA